MKPSRLDEEAIFHEARAIGGPEARGAYLDRACGTDRGLRDRAEALLRAYDEERSFLEAPAVGSPAAETAGPPQPAEEAGQVIGPYKLLEPIGEGGMGVVFMAEQARPVRRRVALKVIKPGMDTRQVIARFEAERQALALMDHPNIARVLDAGATDSGRPYFVMELVRGIPITEYCDREHLSIPERLELFVLVCRAIQHAHQKGVIHRDLKPSNVLVTVIDGVAVPKVIDFGVAKATGQGLAERTLFTGFHQFVGTPLYMSPEQADLSGVDVDTRSDVYALGVLLYELLTGTTPFDPGMLRGAALDEVRRIVREDEPPRPSARLSTLGEELTTVSADRRSEARQLCRAVRGELDWIVMKCLEKDRQRRYETASDLAADAMRYLTDRPVEAGPPSPWYRFAKFARRNRAALTTAALVGLALLGGTAASLWQAGQARRAADQARRAEREATARASETRQVLDSLVKDVFGATAPGPSRGAGPMTVGHLLDHAEATIAERFRGQPLLEAHCRAAFAEVYHYLDRAKAEANAARALELFSRILGPDHPDTLRARGVQLDVLGNHWGDPVRGAAWILQVRRLLADRLRVLGPAHPDTIWSMTALADAIVAFRQFDEAEALGAQALADAERFLGPDHPVTLQARRNLAVIAANHGDCARAEALIRPAVEANLRLHGPLHLASYSCNLQLSVYLRAQGKLAEATRSVEALFEAMRQLDDRRTPWVDWWFDYLFGLYRDGGNLLAARDLAQRWISEVLATPRPPVRDPYDRRPNHLVLGVRSLLSLPASVPIDVALAVRAAEEEDAASGGESDSRYGGVLNNLAWWLATGPITRLGNPERAVEYARRAVKLQPGRGEIQNTLGVALYRAGDWKAAVDALGKSMSSPQGGDSFDWFFLAMARWQLGDRDEARSWYEKAVAWMDKNKPGDVELIRFRAEAAALLDVAELPADVFARPGAAQR